jgi:hypothetical protein
MSLTEAEVAICNQSLARIGSTTFTYAVQTSVQAEKCILHYEQTRNALQRSFEWPFCSERDTLAIVKTITLDSAPAPDAWAVDDEITGTSSYTTATVVSVTSDIEYDIAYISGDFTDGETITNATDIEIVTWEGIPLEYEDETVLWYDESASDDVKCGTGYPSVEDSAPEFGYDYKYKLPEDFDRLKRNWRRRYQHWDIEGDYLLSDDDSVYIEYIKKVTDPDEFDPLFIEILILTLARKLISTLAGTKSSPLVQEVNQELFTVLARAKAVCRAETEDLGRSDWNLARYGSGKITPSRSATSG